VKKLGLLLPDGVDGLDGRAPAERVELPGKVAGCQPVMWRRSSQIVASWKACTMASLIVRKGPLCLPVRPSMAGPGQAVLDAIGPAQPL
jgi:hypothetical protein